MYSVSGWKDFYELLKGNIETYWFRDDYKINGNNFWKNFARGYYERIITRIIGEFLEQKLNMFNWVQYYVYIEIRVSVIESV